MLERKLTLEGGTLYCDLGSLEPGGGRYRTGERIYEMAERTALIQGKRAIVHSSA